MLPNKAIQRAEISAAFAIVRVGVVNAEGVASLSPGLFAQRTTLGYKLITPSTLKALNNAACVTPCVIGSCGHRDPG